MTQNTWRRGLALGNAPDTRILRWRYQHVGIFWRYLTLKFALAPTPTPDASQWNIGGIGPSGVGAGIRHVHFMFFVLISFAFCSQPEKDQNNSEIDPILAPTRHNPFLLILKAPPSLTHTFVVVVVFLSLKQRFRTTRLSSDAIHQCIVKKRVVIVLIWGLPLIVYAPRGRGGGQVSYTFLLCITCKKGGRGSDSM